MKSETAERLGNWMSYKAFQELDSISEQLGELYQSKKIFPEAKNIFKAFELCKPDKVKVVILGQCPYHNTYISRRDGITTKPYSTGLCFGNDFDVPKRSPSLELIKQAVIESNGMFLDDSCESWAEQGVLCLNSALTVEENLPNSHNLLWQPFTESLLREFSKNNTGIIYILIGSVAGKYYGCLSPFTSQVLTCEHPSRALHEGRPWKSEQVFKQANAALYKISKDIIRW
jgi:uracil-DNA glycosylase